MTAHVAVWMPSILCLLLILVVLRSYKRLSRRNKRILDMLVDIRLEDQYNKINEFQQQAAFYQLYSYLAPSFPLPVMRGWALSPDFALLLVKTIEDLKPLRVVELGSGTSTLICAYCLRRLGAGEVLSIDHDPWFAEKTRVELDRHGLSDWADVRFAALEPSAYTDDAARPIEWYDTQVVDGSPDDINIVIVDGPPREGGSLVRYPALPALKRKLAQGALVLLDDADRPAEQAVVARWQQEFPSAEFVHESTEKGTAIVRL